MSLHSAGNIETVSYSPYSPKSSKRSLSSGTTTTNCGKISPMAQIPLVAIVGRTNVGKSTLFNALIGRRTSVTEDSPGVTRDRSYGTVNSFGVMFRLIDTGGLVGEEDDQLHSSVKMQTRLAIQEADAIIVVFDGIAGVHPLDHLVMDELRQTKKPIVWVANKCEKEVNKVAAAEFYALGIDDIIPISAAHREGLRALVRRLGELVGPLPAGTRESTKKGKGNKRGREEISLKDLIAAESAESAGSAVSAGYARTAEPNFDADTELDEQVLAALNSEEGAEGTVENPITSAPIRVAVIGRPNVGKSTLINKIIGEDRLVTSPIAGTTRDAIDISVKRDGREYVFVDTAGLRRKARVDDGSVERYSNLRTLRALAQCDVVVFVIDAIEGAPSAQDAAILGLAHERGKAIVLVVNKWDAIEKDHRTVHTFQNSVYNALKFARYAPVLFVSALLGRRCPSVLATVGQVFDNARVRISTGDLNRVIERAISTKTPPIYRGEPLKFYFATQVSVAPPTIVFFLNHPRAMHFAYERYLRNIIRTHFPFVGSDIKFQMRKKKTKEERLAEGVSN